MAGWLDVERQWLLAKALLEDPDARIQWIFVSDVVKAWLLEWALARGESSETIERASEVMHQPNPGGVHDDHIHVRTACSPVEIAAGCEPMGPRRSWLSYFVAASPDTDEDLARELLQPMPEVQAVRESRARVERLRPVRRDRSAPARPESLGAARVPRPPFCVGAKFGARARQPVAGARPGGQSRTRTGGPSLDAYLKWLEARLAAVRECLTSDGTMWLHLDHRAVHEAGGVGDRVFGARAFMGEIIWATGNAPAGCAGARG